MKLKIPEDIQCKMCYKNLKYFYIRIVHLRQECPTTQNLAFLSYWCRKKRL